MEDFFGLPLLTSDRLEPLFKYNFLTLDKNNIANWKEKEHFIATVSNFIAAGKWLDLTEEYKFWDGVMREIRPLG